MKTEIPGWMKTTMFGYSTNAMLYIQANKGLALQAGFTLREHRNNEKKMILNEKEVMFKDSLADYETLQEKAAALEGTIHTNHEIKQIIQKEYE